MIITCCCLQEGLVFHTGRVVFLIQTGLIDKLWNLILTSSPRWSWPMHPACFWCQVMWHLPFDSLNTHKMECSTAAFDATLWNKKGMYPEAPRCCRKWRGNYRCVYGDIHYILPVCASFFWFQSHRPNHWYHIKAGTLLACCRQHFLFFCGWPLTVTDRSTSLGQDQAQSLELLNRLHSTEMW